MCIRDRNITLRFTLDMAEYFRLLMQDKDLAAVITTQGDATEADPAAPRAVFRQGGLDTLPLEQSGMQGLYVVDGGKVVYQQTGAGPLEYTLSWGGHDVTLRSAADNSSTVSYTHLARSPAERRPQTRPQCRREARKSPAASAKGC